MAILKIIPMHFFVLLVFLLTIFERILNIDYFYKLMNSNPQFCNLQVCSPSTSGG